MEASAQARFNAYAQEIDAIEEQLGGQDELRYQASFERWVRGGHGPQGLRSTDRPFFEKRNTIGLEGGQAAYPGATSGVVVPMAYADAIVSATKYAGPLLQLATVKMTPGGNPMAFPGDNDTTVTAALMTEAGAASAVNINLNQVILEGYKVHSNIVVMSVEAVEDSRVTPNLHAYLAERFGVRFGRLINQYATTGSGSGVPTGFITAAGAAVGSIAGANANDGTSTAHNSIGTGDCTTLQAALDYSYFLDATWQVHPATLAVLSGQLDKQGRLLYPGLQNDVQTINGKRIFANPNMDPLPQTTSGTYNVLALGDFSKLVIRMATPTFIRLEQTYAINGQVGFLAYTRVDSNIVDGGGGAIKYMTCVV